MSEGAGAEGAVGFGFMVIFFFILFVLALGGYYVLKKLKEWLDRGNPDK
jgi:hypothetical protein